MDATEGRFSSDIEQIVGRLRAAGPACLAAEALAGGPPAWAVGGAVRDAALGREVTDLDLAVDGDPRACARALAKAGRGHVFQLSSEFGTWRVTPRDPGERWQLDVTALRGGGIAADLALRDFTSGAMAVRLAGDDRGAKGRDSGASDDGPDLIDPLGGLDDLAAGRLRAASDHAFEDDPLRILRAARLAASLALEPDPETAELARRSSSRAAEPAGERLFEELRLLVTSPDPRRGLELMGELGATPGVLPELDALRGVEQGPNHHLDVYDHTLAVLDGVIELERDPAGLISAERLGSRAPEVAAAVREHLAETLADRTTRAGALRFGALFHDLGKPETRVERDGFVGFPGHDRAGADLIGGIARRLALSSRMRRHLAAMSLYHLRLGFMIPERPLSRRQELAYIRELGDAAVDVTLLTVADRLAARGAGDLARPEMLEAHLELAAQMIERALDWRRSGPPQPLLRGDELAAELGREPGPWLAEAVAELEAAQYCGEVTTREEAVQHMLRLCAR